MHLRIPISPYVYAGLRDKQSLFTISTHTIIDACCEVYKVSYEDLRGKKRFRRIVECRHLAMALCRICCELSLNDVGRLFGDKDHSSVIHALNKCGELLEFDDVFNSRFNKVCSLIGSISTRADTIRLQLINYSKK